MYVHRRPHRISLCLFLVSLLGQCKLTPRGYLTVCHSLPGKLSRYSDWLRAGQSGDRIPVVARFSAPVQTGPGAHPASCAMGTGSFPGVKSGRGLTLTPRYLLVPWSRKSRAIPLLPLWAVQNLSACTGVHFTFYATYYSTAKIKPFERFWITEQTHKQITNIYFIICKDDRR